MNGLLRNIERILRNRRTRRMLQRTISMFAAIVVFFTTYALVLPAITMEKTAGCGIEEHQHDDSCYEDQLICGLEESEEHQHTADCYERVLVCGKEAHTHSAACYPAEAEVETGADENTGNTVAVDATANTDGTVTGDTAGNGADTFVETTEGGETEVPPSDFSDTTVVIDPSNPSGQVTGGQVMEDPAAMAADPAAAAVAYPAVIFDDAINVRSTGLNTDTEIGTESGLQTLVDETSLFVHVEADEETFPEGTTMVLSEVTDDTIDTVATAVEGALSAQDAAANAQQAEDASKAQTRTRGFHALDISFYDLEGNKIEPLRPVRVSITSDAIRTAVQDETTVPVVVHVEDQTAQTAVSDNAGGAAAAAETAAAETAAEGPDTALNSTVVEAAETTEAAATGRQEAAADAGQTLDTLTFEAGAFSVYAIVYTVDFHWEVNGKTYNFSIPGGGFVSLEHVVEVLGIANTDTHNENSSENAENGVENDIHDGVEESDMSNTGTYSAADLNALGISEETRRFVADVESVEFSSPELVWVGKAETDSTVGRLKEANELECEYSADLTEEQIEEINAQTVETGDWALISMHPFISEEYLTVTMKNGDQFTVKVTDAQIRTRYLSDNGDLYEVTVTYDDEAQIPEDAQLKVTPYDEKSEEYAAIRSIVFEKTENEAAETVEAEEKDAENAEAAEAEETKSEITETILGNKLRALDISIVDVDGNTIEPQAPVRVELVIKSLAGELEAAGDTMSVIHLDASSGEIQAETVADAGSMGNIQLGDETATATFTLNSFSQFAITLANYVQVNVHYVDVSGNELAGSTTSVSITQWNTELQFSSYTNGMSASGYTYLGAHYGTYSGQAVTSLKATYNTTAGSLVSDKRSITFYNGSNIVARQEYESSLRQVDVYLVYAPSSGYYIQDTIGEDGCLTVYNGKEAVQTGIDENLFVRWYRCSTATGEFQEVTQSKILNGNYNIPELGGPKVNVAIDEGADQYYKAEIFKVENNEEVKLAETAAYHVPYYDDVRNGGFETPHNNTTNGSGRYWPSNYQVESGQEGVIWKTTGLGPAGKLKQDIEIPQGAAADGTGANDLGETLRNYCFAFMPEGNQCAELNCEASGALYQDVLTIPGSQIYWSLYHRARGGYDKWKSNPDKTQNKETDTMYVVAMPKDLAEKYDVTTQEKVLSVLAHVNDPDSEFHDVEIVRITTTNQGNGEMEFLNSGNTMTVPPTWFGNLANGQTATANDGNTRLTYGNTDWHYYTGNFSIPKDQYLTRFFFVAGNTASGNPTMGNFLDDINLSDSVPSPNYGQATAIVQKTVKGLDALPESYATRIETTYKVTSYSGIISSTDRNSDYDLYRTQIDEDGKAVSTASWTFPITIGSGGSAAFTNGKEVSPLAEGKTDEIDGYEQTTTWTISKRNTNGEELTVVASGTGKVIPDEELAKLRIIEKDVVCIEFVNSYQKKQPVSIWKTDMNSRTITSGAVFELYKAEDFDDSTNTPKEGTEKVATGTTGTNGILYLGELSKGEYRLLETKAPDGYNLPDTAIKITVSDNKVTAMQGSSYFEAVTKGNDKWVEGQTEDTKQIQVWNNPGVELPATGGPGTYKIYLLGFMFTGLAGAGLVMKRRRKEAA